MAPRTETEETQAPMLNIYQRINAIQREATYVQKDQKGGLKYAVTSHDAVVGLLRPYMVKHGIVAPVDVERYEQDGNRTTVYIAVSFINMDAPQDRLVVHGFGFGCDNQDKGPGKALSYAVKYVLMKTFLLEAGEAAESPNYKTKDEAAREGRMGSLGERRALLDRMGDHKKRLSLSSEEAAQLKMDKQVPDDLRVATMDELERLEEELAKRVGMLSMSDADETVMTEFDANKEKGLRRKAYDLACELAAVFGGKEFVDTLLQQEVKLLGYSGLDQFSSEEMRGYVEKIRADVAKEMSGRE